MLEKLFKGAEKLYPIIFFESMKWKNENLTFSAYGLFVKFYVICKRYKNAESFKKTGFGFGDGKLFSVNTNARINFDLNFRPRDT